MNDEGNVPILAAMSDVAGVPGGDIFHSSLTSLLSDECGEGGGGEENVSVARVWVEVSARHRSIEVI